MSTSILVYPNWNTYYLTEVIFYLSRYQFVGSLKVFIINEILISKTAFSISLGVFAHEKTIEQ